MKSRPILVVAVLLSAWLFPSAVLAENYLLNGGATSTINYRMVQEVTPKPSTRKLVLSYVLPQSFDSPTYKQDVSDLKVLFQPEPTQKKEFTDARGNRVLKATWRQKPLKPVRSTIRLTAKNSVNLKALNSSEPFPLSGLPKSVRPFLQGSELVDINEPAIRKKARELTASSKTELAAVKKITDWVADHMKYTLYPDSYDATMSFVTGRGNCQNYAHLAAALMRSVGIPVRIVNGITLEKPYQVHLPNGYLTMNMAEGRHSWIEVYFPDLGWMPFDPQNSALFVSNRFIRVETGVDNDEAVQDGLVLWSQVKGSSGTPEYTEMFQTGFLADKVDFKGKKTGYGPRAMLLYPDIQSAFGRVQPAAPTRTAFHGDLAGLGYDKPLVMGNLEFPENVNFAAPPKKTFEGPDGTMEMRKSFFVETAEYVTPRGRQYAQAFTLDKPLRLDELGLALYKFGGQGLLWLEIYEDKDTNPGKKVATSELIDVAGMKPSQGYAWTDFDFTQSRVLLAPGDYWAALCFTGDPIVNWFYSYGKPTGPENGTRSRALFDQGWPNILAHEFNFRVKGMTGE